MIKTYRSLLAALLALSVLSGIGTINVSAENDTEPEIQTESVTEAEAVSEEGISPETQKMMNVLKTFGIISEYYDYNIPLTYEVSRADFAVSVAKMMGITEYGGSEVYFYDVPANYWAFNEISSLTRMGILNGEGDKVFNPGEPITKAAAYKMLLCAMGYRELAERSGGYPRGYTKIAGNVKLSRGVSGGENVTMSDMLRILYNALTVNVMEIGNFEGGSIVYEASEDETLISMYRDIYYEEGCVNGANTVTLNGEAMRKGYTLIDSEEYKSEGFDMMEYLGEKVEFFYESNDSSEEKTLLWVGRKASSQDVRRILVDGYANLDTDTFVYTYQDANDRQHRVNLDRSVLLIYNGSIVDSGYDAILNRNRYELKLVSSGGKYTVMAVREYESFIVGSINSADQVVYDKNKPGDSVSLKEEEYDTFSIKLMGNDDMSFEDIKKDAVLTVYRSLDNRHIEVYVSYNTVSGTLEGIDTAEYTKITINGNEYRVDGKVAADGYSVGDEVTAYTDVYGEIVYITAKAGSYQGSFLLSIDMDRRGDRLVIRQLGEDSKVSKLTCAERLTIDGVRYKNHREAYNALLDGSETLTAQFALIKKNKDGEITDIDTTNYNKERETSNSLQIDVPFWYGSETTYTQRLIRATAGAARIGEKIVYDANTKVFIVPFVTDYESVSEDDLWVTVGSKLVNDTGAYAQSYKTAKSIGIAKYVLLKAYNPRKVAAEMPILAKKITSGTDDDGNTVEILEGYQGASAVAVKADESAGKIFSESGVLPGDIVTLTKDGYGKIKGCTVAYDYRTGEHKALTALNDIVGMFVGYANDVVDDVVKIGFTSGEECDFAINAMSKPVLVYDKANAKNPISVASTGDIVTYMNSTQKCSTVFIVTNRMQPQLFVVYK